MAQPLNQILSIARKNNLAGLEILWKFSYTDLQKIYNGIGPDRFPQWLRTIITEANGLFEPAAVIHDVQYHLGGTYDDFTAANKQFKENCYVLVKAAYGWYNPARYKWLFRARRYAEYCQVFGWSGYHKAFGVQCACARCVGEPR